MDMPLVIETSNQAWYLVYGGTLRPYVEESGVTPHPVPLWCPAT